MYGSKTGLFKSRELEDETLPAKVLVVDDSSVIQRIVEASLQKEGLSSRSAYSATAALSELEEYSPDLILCDIVMPKIDGIEFCEALKADSRYKDIPVIFFTVLSKSETLSRAYKAGASDYIAKPINHVELIARARNHINSYRNKKKDLKRIVGLLEQNKYKTDALGATTHDLRNPISSIRGVAEMLESERFGLLSDEQRELVSILVDASDSMMSLVEDLLNASMMRKTEISPDLEKSCLLDLVQKSVAMQSVVASRKTIEIRQKIDLENADANIDPKLVSRVIDNLLSNAIKFSNPGSLVHVGLSGNEKEVVLRIRDDGPGIAEDEFEKLFKEYSKTSNRPTAGEPSIGLGLFLCKRIIDSHGGTIHAENHPRGGAQFVVSLQRNLTK